MNFKSKAGYKKWLAYGHMHVKDFGKTPQKITIAGKSHKVKHGHSPLHANPMPDGGEPGSKMFLR